MKKVLVSFDNTMGVPGCDVDDMLALLMLLGRDDVEVVGVCTCFGNSDIETVHANTLRLFSEAGLDTRIGIPVYKGAEKPMGNPRRPLGDTMREDPTSATSPAAPSEAARAMAQAAAASPGELSLLATGTLTDVAGAAAVDPAFFDNIREISLMGGYTESLFINGTVMDELNVSSDPAASFAVLASGCPVTIATAQNCLAAYFDKESFTRRFGRDSWIGRECAHWFSDMEERYRVSGWVCWDVVAAAALVEPELFCDAWMDVALNRRWISVGYLEKAGEGVPSARVRVPRIADAEAFKERVCACWETALSKLGI